MDIPKYIETMKEEDGAWISQGRTGKFYNALVGGNATLMLDAVKSIMEHLDGGGCVQTYKCSKPTRLMGPSDGWAVIMPGEMYITFDPSHNVTFWKECADKTYQEMQFQCVFVMAYYVNEKGILPTQCGMVPFEWKQFIRCDYGVSIFRKKVSIMIGDNFTTICGILGKIAAGQQPRLDGNNEGYL